MKTKTHKKLLLHVPVWVLQVFRLSGFVKGHRKERLVQRASSSKGLIGDQHLDSRMKYQETTYWSCAKASQMYWAVSS